MLSKTELTQQIKSQATALGFQKVGIIPAHEMTVAGNSLKDWLAASYQAEMDWMVTHLEKRLEPRLLMEGVKSIVCVAMNYYTPDVPNPAPDAVKIAKYAQGTDYHYVVKDRLKALLQEIQARVPGIEGRALTDSAPILEKAMAVEAGLGWYGKNGNLLTQDYGSWVFLGELLLNVELDYDTPTSQNLCGRCTRCIDACPTEAIVSPTVVDANQCLAYWTIEYKGEEIPTAIAEKMEGWVFGCDICQDVCPWNIRFAQETEEAAFQPRQWNRAPQGEELLGLDEEAFRDRYRKSPIKRTKLKGLQRNVKAAMKD